ncbi:hypothetical protein [Xylanivirga thermophila]|uniref:hypothetical protein n=1 Tax=Xylanivirga thermophila TaxID=2496273 RepID=UPI00101CD834|nr:hypothetical protein [Xylanivirga thermophila]
MNNVIKWKNTSLNIDSLSEQGEIFIDVLNNEGIDLRNNVKAKILENQKNYYILEDDFIEDSKNLVTIIRKYTQKNYESISKLYIPETKEFMEVKADSRDKIIYEKIIGENRIDGDIRSFPISVNVLNEVFNSKKHKSLLLIDVFILLAISNKSSFEAEEFLAEFKEGDKSLRIRLDLQSDPLLLFPIYNWIFNREEYKESYDVKLNIVRQVIINKQSLSDVDELLEDSKLAFKRIISNKTDDYFEQLNQLKDDFLVLSKNENSALRTLNLTFFAWLGYLGMEVFKIVIDYKGSDIIPYLLWSNGAKKGIIILMFITALIFIFIAYVLEIKSLEKTYDVIKKIYKDKILFETGEGENKFETTIEKPEIGKLQKLVFTVIIILLFFRFFLTFPW